MKVRSALSAVLLGSLAVTAVGVSSGSASAGGSALAGRSAIAPRVDTVTVTGTFEQVVVDTADGEHFRYLVRGADHTWWLEGLTEPVPTTGSQVTVTGTPRRRGHADGCHDPGAGRRGRPRGERGGARYDAGARPAPVLGPPRPGAADAGHGQEQGAQDQRRLVP